MYGEADEPGQFVREPAGELRVGDLVGPGDHRRRADDVVCGAGQGERRAL
ncbi:hypothetical protein [Streptomyces sp. NPDC058989]